LIGITFSYNISHGLGQAPTPTKMIQLNMHSMIGYPKLLAKSKRLSLIGKRVTNDKNEICMTIGVI